MPSAVVKSKKFSSFTSILEAITVYWLYLYFLVSLSQDWTIAHFSASSMAFSVLVSTLSTKK